MGCEFLRFPVVFYDLDSFCICILWQVLHFRVVWCFSYGETGVLVSGIKTTEVKGSHLVWELHEAFMGARAPG